MSEKIGRTRQKERGRKKEKKGMWRGTIRDKATRGTREKATRNTRKKATNQSLPVYGL